MSAWLSWDPMHDLASESEVTITPQCSYRLKRDIMSLLSEPLEGVLIEPDERRFLMLHVLITGASGTPYEKGFFYFVLGFPGDYPLSPPKVRLMNTGDGRVRFNPNIYSSGKVCLSILGTYPGPGWTAAQGVRSVLLNIQSLLNEKPYTNEPGYEKERKPGDSLQYNEMLIHETMKVAILGMIRNGCRLEIPETFTTYMKETFRKNYGFYESLVIERIHMSGKPIVDPLFKAEYGNFQYNYMLDQLEQQLSNLTHEPQKEGSEQNQS